MNDLQIELRALKEEVRKFGGFKAVDAAIKNGDENAKDLKTNFLKTKQKIEELETKAYLGIDVPTNYVEIETNNYEVVYGPIDLAHKGFKLFITGLIITLVVGIILTGICLVVYSQVLIGIGVLVGLIGSIITLVGIIMFMKNTIKALEQAEKEIDKEINNDNNKKRNTN